MVWHSPATAQQCASAVVLKILQIGTLMECTLEGPYTHNSAFCLQLSLVNKDKVSKTSVSYSEGCTWSRKSTEGDEYLYLQITYFEV